MSPPICLRSITAATVALRSPRASAHFAGPPLSDPVRSGRVETEMTHTQWREGPTNDSNELPGHAVVHHDTSFLDDFAGHDRPRVSSSGSLGGPREDTCHDEQVIVCQSLEVQRVTQNFKKLVPNVLNVSLSNEPETFRIHSCRSSSPVGPQPSVTCHRHGGGRGRRHADHSRPGHDLASRHDMGFWV